MLTETTALSRYVITKRRMLGETQEEFAENCGLSVELISLIERGQANPRMDTLAKIAAYLNVSISEMLQDS